MQYFEEKKDYRLQSFIRLLAFRFNNILKSFKFGPLVLWAADPIFHLQGQFFCRNQSKDQNRDPTGLLKIWINLNILKCQKYFLLI